MNLLFQKASHVHSEIKKQSYWQVVKLSMTNNDDKLYNRKTYSLTMVSYSHTPGQAACMTDTKQTTCVFIFSFQCVCVCVYTLMHTHTHFFIFLIFWFDFSFLLKREKECERDRYEGGSGWTRGAGERTGPKYTYENSSKSMFLIK